VAVVPLVQSHGAISVTASTVCVGCLPLLLIAAPFFPQTLQLGTDSMILIAVLAIGSTVIATLAWNVAVARLPGPVSAQFLYGIPVVGMATGHIMLCEVFSAGTWLALICILCGLWFGRDRSKI